MGASRGRALTTSEGASDRARLGLRTSCRRLSPACALDPLVCRLSTREFTRVCTLCPAALARAAVGSTAAVAACRATSTRVEACTLAAPAVLPQPASAMSPEPGLSRSNSVVSDSCLARRSRFSGCSRSCSNLSAVEACVVLEGSQRPCAISLRAGPRGRRSPHARTRTRGGPSRADRGSHLWGLLVGARLLLCRHRPEGYSVERETGRWCRLGRVARVPPCAGPRLLPSQETASGRRHALTSHMHKEWQRVKGPPRRCRELFRLRRI